MIGVFCCEELARGSPWTTRSGDEIGLGLKLALVGTGCIEVLWEKSENENGRGGREARGDPLGLDLFDLRREIGRCMPTSGIRCTEPI